MITINQQPTYPNVTKTNLLYGVSSDSPGQFQFQYVMDIVSGSTRLTRIKQYPNPNGAAIFDAARILDDYLEYRTDIFTTGSAQNYGSGLQTFSVRFGEEYGTSTTSPTTVYDGNGSAGDPAVSGSDAVVWGGTIDINNGVGYNFSDVYSDNIFLSSYPNTQTSNPSKDYKKVSRNDYGLIAYKGSYVTGSLSVDFYNSSNSNIGSLNLNGIQDANGTYLPAGLKNFDGLVSSSILDTTDYYVINIDTEKDYYFKVVEDCYWGRVNFMFINKFGVWDFYGVNLPKRRTTNITRQEITKPFVDYSSTTSQYNILRRGGDYYNIQLEDRYQISSDFLTEEQASWLSEMIESPSVYIQEGNKFVPILITNSSYVHNTNIKAQKVFTYLFEYQYSNQRYSK